MKFEQIDPQEYGISVHKTQLRTCAYDTGRDSCVYKVARNGKNIAFKFFNPDQVDRFALTNYADFTNDMAKRYKNRTVNGYIVTVNPFNRIGVVAASYERELAGVCCSDSSWINGSYPLITDPLTCFLEEHLTNEAGIPYVTLAPQNIRIDGKRVTITDLCVDISKFGGKPEHRKFFQM